LNPHLRLRKHPRQGVKEQFKALLSGGLTESCPHFADTFTSAGLVEGGSHSFQIVIEQVGVDVQRHRYRSVPQHLLDRFDVRTGRDRKAGRSVTKVVWCGARDTGCADRFVEPPRPRMRAFQVSAIVAGEQQIVAAPVLTLAGQIRQQEIRSARRRSEAIFGR
jgi:hypothetical protein